MATKSSNGRARKRPRADQPVPAAASFPEQAAHDAGGGEYPQLLDAFERLCRRVEASVERQYHDLTQAAVDLYYPQFGRPVPALATAAFLPEPGQAAGVV